MVSPLKNTTFEPQVVLKADGALRNDRHERLALMIAEGIPDMEAWKGAGGLTKESRKYGRRIFANAVFIERVRVLTEEKAELERDPIWGEAMWQVNQLWRQAIAVQDLRTMSEAAKMRLTIAEKMQAAKPAPEPAAPTRGPGAPTADSHNSRRLGVNEIRESLMAKNREVEAPDPDETIN